MKYRSQVDFDEQERLNAVGTECDPKEDRTRHELVPETDLNRLLKRFSPFELPQGATFYGERDYDLDNAEEMARLVQLRDQAYAKWQSMSDDERAPWPTVNAFITAVERPVAPAQTSTPGAGGGEPPAAGAAVPAA